MSKFSRVILNLTVIFILGLTPLLWFKGESLIGGADVGFQLNPAGMLYQKMFTWGAVIDTGRNSVWGVVPAFDYMPQAFLMFLELSLQTVEKIWFIFLFMFAGLSMFFFACQLRNAIDSEYEFFPLLAAIFYMFNIFNMVTWAGVDRVILESIVAVPLISGLYYRGLKKENFFFSAVLMAFVSVFYVSAIGNPPSFLVGFSIIAVFILVSLLITLFRKDIVRFKKRLKFICLILLFSVLFNLWIILPYINQVFYQLGCGKMHPLSWLGGMSQSSNFWRVFRLMSSWQWYAGWGGDSYAPYAKVYINNVFFVILSVFFPVLAYSAVFIKRHRFTIFFFAVSLLGMFFAMGTSPPFGFFYKFLSRHMPLFWIFRTPYKFSFLISFSYAILIAISLNGIYLWLKAKGRAGHIAMAVLLGIVGLNFVFCHPFLSGGIFPVKGPLRKVLPTKYFKIPNYVFETADFLNSQDEYFRVVMLPLKKYNHFKWGYASQGLAMWHFSQKPLLSKLTASRVQFVNFPVAGLMEIFERAFYGAESAYAFKIPAIVSAAYVIQRNDLVYNFFGEKDSPVFIKERLSFQKDVDYLRSFGEFDIYKIGHFIPQVYSLDELSLVSGGIEGILPLTNTELIDKPNFIFEGDGSRELIEKHRDLFKTHILCKDKTHPLDIPAVIMEDKDIFYVLPVETKEFIPVDERQINGELAEGFHESQVFADGSLWKWMSSGMSKITLYNEKKEKQRVNLQISFYCLSPKSVIISLADKQVSALALEPNQNNNILLKDLYLEPGTNTLSLYTPHAPDTMGDFLGNSDKRNIFIAVKEDMKTGSVHNKSRVTEEFEVFRDGVQKIQIYPAALNSSRGDLNAEGSLLTIDNAKVSLRSKGNYLEGERELYRGRHEISFEYEGKDIFNALIIRGDSQDTSGITKVTFKRINPTKYLTDVKAGQPFVLVLNESFDSRWRAKVEGCDGGDIGFHFKINDFANAWFIDKTGNYTVELYYYPQKLYERGIFLSVISVMGSLIGVIFVKNKKRK